MPKTFRNPILPGFYPDPSICRVDEDFYLVTSTFEYFPGLPIFHSRDLVRWHQIGHVLNRPGQLNLDGIRPSGGLYAPTIRHHDGIFYVINTLVDGTGRAGNFIVTSTDPAGSWSDPYWLADAPGIDPSLFFDDSRVWYVGNRHAFEGRYPGHCEIWLQELDLEAKQLVGERYVLWDGAVKGAVYAEAPHLYKIYGRYYLLIAEGGTEHNHAVTIARSEAVTGPFVGNPRNPILTHRHLGLDYPIVGTGHADLVETQYGEWWMVALAMRPYDGYYYNLGRETFLTPVRWEDGWPIVSPGTGRIEAEYTVPNLPGHAGAIPEEAPESTWRDDFDDPILALTWNFLRTPREPLWSLQERPGHLRLYLRPQQLAEWSNPTFLGRRQQHRDFVARAAMDFVPAAPNECAGLALIQNNDYHFRFVCWQNAEGLRVVRLTKRLSGVETLLGEKTVGDGRLYLEVVANGQDYAFYAANTPPPSPGRPAPPSPSGEGSSDRGRAVAEHVDGRLLSTPVAGGFTGAYIGMYASSNGVSSETFADFDWFEYQGT